MKKQSTLSGSAVLNEMSIIQDSKVLYQDNTGSVTWTIADGAKAHFLQFRSGAY